MVTWDATADARLLTSILRVHKIQINYAAVAHDFGSNATAKAISRRLDTIRSRSKAGAPSDDGTPGSGSDEKGYIKGVPVSAANTPKKRRNQKVLDGGIGKMSPAKGRKGAIGKVKREADEVRVVEE